ncbi:Pycsar system effector family protein [Sphingomonas sp. R1]|uniref:Pycsar system effector family protein n=1 Tax=Sphingomonas sp. R1 TaxID=399176 RepID=UPI002224D0EC|nr:Pycsar system effector family protein [Sphingomonas sp. R1]UYY79576.1 DUF5706 domain-containing protein [Sphingomonas sp. R1]
MTDTERLNFALGHLDRIQALQGRVENRGAALLALNLAMASITAANLTRPILATLWAGVALLALAAIGVAFVSLIMVSYSHLANKVRPSLLFFGDIARIESDVYISQAKGASTEDLVEDALCQIWRNSEILMLKFARTQRAFVATCCAIILWMGFLLGVMVQTGALPMLKI